MTPPKRSLSLRSQFAATKRKHLTTVIIASRGPNIVIVIALCGSHSSRSARRLFALRLALTPPPPPPIQHTHRLLLILRTPKHPRNRTPTPRRPQFRLAPDFSAYRCRSRRRRRCSRRRRFLCTKSIAQISLVLTAPARKFACLCCVWVCVHPQLSVLYQLCVWAATRRGAPLERSRRDIVRGHIFDIRPESRMRVCGECE